MLNKDVPKKFFKCFYCQKKYLFTKYSFQSKQKINNQQFYFLLCPQCQRTNYFWSVANQYFFSSKIHIVLHEPEIVGNAGSIIRLAAAFNLQLHLIEPFGFIFSESWLKRSSANHFHLAQIKLYSDWKQFQKVNHEGDFILTSAKGTKSLDSFNFLNVHKPIYLIFGCESKGLPLYLKQKYSNHLLYIKQSQLVSSINLANAVAIFAFFVINQYQILNF